MRVLLAILLLAASLPCAAANPYGYVFTLTPDPVLSGSQLGVTIQTTEPQCLPLPPTINPLVEPGLIRVVIPSSDGCFLVPVETRNYTMTAPPPGFYLFRFVVCGANPPPGSNSDGCFTVEEQNLTVFGTSGTRFTVPAVSAWAAILLGAGLMLAGMLWRARV